MTECSASMSFDEAISVLRENAQALGIETAKLSKAGRRILAEPLLARLDAPRYDAAAMDGFAVEASDAPLDEYNIVGSSYPGQPWLARLKPGQAIRIMTGAAVPEGAHRVVPLEMAKQVDGRVLIGTDWPKHLHIRACGSDFKAGQRLLAPGVMLGPRALVVAAAADVSTVKVWRRPVVGVIASGDELKAPGQASGCQTAVPDSLSEAILLLARQYDAKPLRSALVPDSVEDISQAAAELLIECDVIVVIGGASRGDRDFAKAALAQHGVKVQFSDLAIKPGKPTWYGRVGQRHVLGLPGNPTAAMTIARLFLGPLVQALGGAAFEKALRWTQMPLAQPSPAGGTREMFLGAADTMAGVLISGGQASNQLGLADTNLLVRLPANAPVRRAGELIDALKFDGNVHSSPEGYSTPPAPLK